MADDSVPLAVFDYIAFIREVKARWIVACFTDGQAQGSWDITVILSLNEEYCFKTYDHYSEMIIKNFSKKGLEV